MTKTELTEQILSRNGFPIRGVDGANIYLKDTEMEGRPNQDQREPGAALKTIMEEEQLVWIYGFEKNFDPVQRTMWTEIEDAMLLTEDEFGTIDFVTQNGNSESPLKMVFQHPPAEGNVVKIALVSGDRRVQYHLNKSNGAIVARYQIRGEAWQDVGYLVGEDSFTALTEIVHTASSLSRELISRPSSSHEDSAPGTVA